MRYERILPSNSGPTQPHSIDRSIVARIGAHSRMSPDTLAVADDRTSVSYSRLLERARAVANDLRNAGAGRETCVALWLDRSVDFVVAALAVLKTGAAYLPLDACTPFERVKLILRDAGAQILLTHRKKGKPLTGEAWKVLDMDELSDAAEPGFHDQPAEPSQLAYIIYTSGSTGRPKGVEITHANLLNLIEWHQRAFEVSSSDRATQVAGLGFDAAVWEIWPALCAGASLHIPDETTRRSPEALRDWMVQQRITISFVPTVLAEQMLHMPWPADTSLRTLLTGADTLHRRPPPDLPFVLVNNYGPTECTVVATSGEVRPGGNEQPSIGKPIDNTRALILDEALHPVPEGEVGELCLAGAHVGRGYRNNPQLTAEKFVEYRDPSGEPMRIYRTGDRVKMLPSGEIAFLGRLDDQVKVRGYRVELGEIVACLDQFPGVDASAVILRNGESAPALVAYVAANRSARLTASDLYDFLAVRLPDYMIPAQFVAVPSLPMTSRGKLDRSALPAPNPQNLLASPTKEPANTPEAPGRKVEQRLAEMVARLLDRESVARNDNFFLLGGHSMLGVQLVARIRDAFGVKLTLRQLFGAPTVAALADQVQKQMAVPSEPSVAGMK